jgi:hypothetical protein
VEDKSKFGTFVNDVRCTKDTKVDLKAQDKIRFGTNPNDFYILEWLPLVFTSSMLSSEQKGQLRDLTASIGMFT